MSEIISSVVWTFLLIKFFIYDIDNYIINNYFPGSSWLLKYKLFLFLAFILLLLIILNKKRFFKLIGFLLVYPLFFLFWRIPRLLFGNKNWMGLFTALGISISFFKSLTLNLTISTAVLLSVLFIFISKSKTILLISIAILAAFLIIHFIRRFSYSFKRFDIISKLSNYILDFWLHIQNSILEIEAQKDSNDATSLEKREVDSKFNRLQLLLTLNKTCSFLISKLRYIQKSSSTFIYYSISLVNSILITVFVFACMYFGVYKAGSSNFSGTLSGHFIDFYYYSFSLFFGGPDPGFHAVSNLAKILSMAEIFFRFLVVGILLYYIFTIIREKHKTDIETSIIQLQLQSDKLENIIGTEFHMSINNALKEVERIKGSMLKIINYLVSNN